MPLILGTNSIKDTGYDVANSLRFDDGSSDYLSKTFASAGNTKKWTWSCWFKKSDIPATWTSLIEAGVSGSQYFSLGIDGSERLILASQDEGAGGVMNLWSSQLIRDISAWYHFVVAYDSAQATSSDRVKGYINGEQITSFNTANYPAQNKVTYLNGNYEHRIGRRITGQVYNGYMAEVCLIDGTALDATSFGEFDEDTGIWKPIDVSGLTFGTNGFYLDFENSGSLGTDVSGNGNNFTVNNLTSIDQSTDTCTNNFATGNPIASQAGSAQSNSLLTFSEGNLLMADNSETGIANFGLSSGKWFWEVKVIADQDGLIIGACNEHFNINAELGYNSPASATGAKAFGYYGGNGTATVSVDDGSGFGSYGSAIAVNNIVSVALDLDSADQSCTFYLNGSSQGALDITNLSSGESYFPAVGNWSASDVSTSWNFGSPQYSESGGNSDGNGYGNFSMAVPSGYYALNTKNLAEYG